MKMSRRSHSKLPSHAHIAESCSSLQQQSLQDWENDCEQIVSIALSSKRTLLTSHIVNGLNRSKAVLWAQLMQSLTQLLDRLCFSATVSFGDHLAIRWAIQSATVALGREFVGETEERIEDCRAFVVLPRT